MQIVTMRSRFEYLKSIYEDKKENKDKNLTFAEFMELIFSKIETEIRLGKDGLDAFYQIGEHRVKPINAHMFKYDYEK